MGITISSWVQRTFDDDATGDPPKIPFSCSSIFTRTAFEEDDTKGSSKLLDSLEEILIIDSICLLLRGRNSLVLGVGGGWAVPLTLRFRLAVEVEGPASAGFVGVRECPFVALTLFATRCINPGISKVPGNRTRALYLDWASSSWSASVC